jgi:OmpA-OmpF porin, OOP family
MTERIVDWPRYTRTTWIIAALLLLLLIILMLMGKGPGSAASCCASTAATAPVAPAAPVAAPAPKPVSPLKFSADSGKITLEGTVSSDAQRKQLVADAAAAYGAGNVIDKLNVDPGAPNPAWLEQAGTLLSWLKPGKPLAITGDASYVTLSGAVPSQAEKDERGKWAREFFGNAVTVNNELVVQAPPAPVARAEDVKCGDQITAAVTFATGSATLSAEGKKLLDAIAPCLKNGKYEISGHTDNVGSVAANTKLSQARASAVRAYVILRGANADDLTAKGYANSKPIADNSSAEGRAKNRRIEFAKLP